MTHYVGICDHCREIHSFTTAQVRDEYEDGHPHGKDEDE